MQRLSWASLALVAALGLAGCGSDNPPAGSISAPRGTTDPSAAGKASGESTPAPAPEAIQRGGRATVD